MSTSREPFLAMLSRPYLNTFSIDKPFNIQRRILAYFLYISSVVFVLFYFLFMGNSMAYGYGKNLKPQLKFQDILIDENVVAMDFIEDEQGMLWMASDSGFYKFDGIDIQHYIQNEKQNSILSNAINTLFLDSHGYIWLGYKHAGVSRFDPVTEKFIHFSSSTANHNKVAYEFAGNAIETIVEDKFNNIWVGSDDGLTQITPKRESIETITDDFEILSFTNAPFANSVVNRLVVDKQQNLWVGSDLGLHFVNISQLNSSTFPLNKINLLFKEYKLPLNNSKSISVVSLLADSDQTLWIGTTDQGVFSLNITDMSKGLFKLENDNSVKPRFINHSIRNIEDIKQANNGDIWFATKSGLGLFSATQQVFYLYQQNAEDPTSLATNLIYNIFINQQGVLYLSIPFTIQTVNTNSTWFKTIPINADNKNMLQSKVVVTADFDNQQNLWLSGIATGLSKEFKDKNSKNKSNESILVNSKSCAPHCFINYQLLDKNTEPKKRSVFYLDEGGVVGFKEDSQGRIWLGSFNNGVYKVSANKQHKTHYKYDKEKPNSLSSNWRNRVIIEDSNQRIWVGNQAGVNLYDDLKDSFFRVPILDDSAQTILSIYINAIVETKQYLLIGSGDGRLFYLTETGSKQNKDQKLSFENVKIRLRNAEKKSFTSITSITETQDGAIWLSTLTTGLLKGSLVTNKSGKLIFVGEIYDHRQGLNNNNIRASHADLNDNNRLWLHTEFGISVFYIDRERFYNFTSIDGISSVKQWINCADQAKNGDIYYCGPEGVVYFSPKDIKLNTRIPEVVLTRFYVNNKEVNIEHEDEIQPSKQDEKQYNLLTKNINFTNSITLNYQQSNFAFDFAALDYTAPLKNKYLYMLEGFDKEWIPTNAKRRHANYSNIPAGEYIFKVKGSNNHGFWNEDGATIKINVLPPWYLTLWAKTIFILIFSLLIFSFIRYRTQQQTKTLTQRSIDLEQAVDERTAELKNAQKTIAMQEKMSSLGTLSAGIAHEINNPTNFVYGSCQNMDVDLTRFKKFIYDLAGDDTDEEVLTAFEQKFISLHEHLDIISEGAQRIKKIVSGLGVFSRSDKDEMEVMAINQCIKSTVELVKTEYKDVTHFELVFTDNPKVFCFPSKINQVIMNLLVNASQAIKANSQSKGDDYFGNIRICSTIVHSNCVLKIYDNGQGIATGHITKIFEPFFTTKEAGEGTGLGLSLSYEIIQQHGGSLSVQSTENIGTCFTLVLPLSQHNDPESGKSSLSVL
ncbi:MAG: signal transduction histidine kinase/ligand-binding sensor domain-containing protein [Paraglaciecola sp.]|jgi:signal transduction histidine kinase/ligand-binding sensor domain-containing protein